MACVAPMMTHLLRWAKIALAEEHDDLTDLTFRMISTMGRAVPKEFKTDLPQIVDLMLETDKCDDLACKYIHGIVEYKKLSSMRGWDRKIRPRGHQACLVHHRVSNCDDAIVIYVSKLP